jgi:predicted amidohydrolase YtcJ
MIVENLYDSHTHWLATGETQSGLQLQHLKTKVDLRQLAFKPEDLRGAWLVGFGWNENYFVDLKLDLETLDTVFPEIPVFFSRADGHASWVNSRGLQKLNLAGKKRADFSAMEQGMLGFDSQDQLNGLLKEKFHIEALLSLPAFVKEQKRTFLLRAMRYFNRQGFTHIRDMGSTAGQFKIAMEIEKLQELTLLVVHNFVCENPADFSRALLEALECKQLETELLKVAGMKFYYDGSLGSETALLSLPYRQQTGGPHGVTNWALEDLEAVMRVTWEHGLEISVHTIGDQAAHDIVMTARKLSASGISGILNLEHVQVLRPETILAMKSLHIVCHMQPCHWLGPLYKFSFPWESLRVAKVPVFFGSDSPIEPAILSHNLSALKLSAEAGIREWTGDPLKHHINTQFPLPETYTVLENEKIQTVVFKGRKII